MTDNPTPIAGAELNTIRDHALRARHLLDQVLRGIDEGKPELTAGCLRGVQPHLLQLIRSDARLSALHSVDSECVAKAHALRCKWVEENR